MSGEKIQLVRELHAPARRNFKRRRVIVKGFDDLWQADLVEMRQYAKINKNFNYILTVIDVLSKFAWAVALENKSAQSVVDGFKEVLQSGRSPKNLQSDDGKEFFNVEFKKLMKKHNINQYSTYNAMKASVIHITCGDHSWVTEYNKSKHRTTGMAPIKVNRKNANQLLATVYSNVKQVKPAKYQVGDFIQKVQNTNPRTYLLIDQQSNPIRGGFYEQ
ncbi:uncharacterized protein LOC124416182 [Diprion similis]|uniref:uncharacterized protein LOC124416182 n=1 Tax=Diprion similis TaxID=362088 RepID=UPI001EF8BB4D|nr:uncharacterized protein LOC124416182 [Diprion similis]